jgi:hypothetical protein
MSEVGCLKDGHFQNLQVENTTTADFGTALSADTNGTDVTFKQFDGKEVARIHDGAVLPTVAGTSTSLTAGTGIGTRRRVLTLGSGGDDNILTLTAADSGSVIFATPTNNLTITLPLVGTETGMFFKIVIADKIAKTFKIKTSGDAGDTFFLRAQSLADNGATSDVTVGNDVLIITNNLEGSWVNLTNVAGGDAEIWLAEVFTGDTATATTGTS